MSMSVGVEMGVPGVIMGASDEFALAATAIDRRPMGLLAGDDDNEDDGLSARDRRRAGR